MSRYDDILSMLTNARSRTELNAAGEAVKEDVAKGESYTENANTMASLRLVFICRSEELRSKE